MSNYSLDPAMCRVDVWKESGKWYTTEVIRFKNWDGCLWDAFDEALKESFGERYRGMRVTCLEPYNKNSFPISRIYKGN